MLRADNGRFIYLYTQSSRVRSEGLGFLGKPLKDGVSTQGRAVFAPKAFEWCILSAKFKNAACIFPPSTWRPRPERVFFYRPLELRRVRARYTRTILWRYIFHKSRRFSSGLGLRLWWRWWCWGGVVAVLWRVLSRVISRAPTKSYGIFSIPVWNRRARRVRDKPSLKVFHFLSVNTEYLYAHIERKTLSR